MTDSADWIAHPFGASPHARAAFVAAAGDLDRYPEVPTALRKVLAARYRMRLDGVVIGAGSAELLARVFTVVMREGAGVVANTPSWPLVPQLCRAHRARPQLVPYVVGDGRADHDLRGVLAAIDGSTRLVYLSSPGNPSGRAIDRDGFEAFLDRVPRDVVVVVDEAYAEYATREGALDATAIARRSDRALIVLRTFSKVYGLAGLRAGYALTSPSLARALEEAGPRFVLARGVEAAAVAALGDATHVKKTVAHVAARRDAIARDGDARGVAWLASDAPWVLTADLWAEGPRYFDDRYVMIPAVEKPHG